MEISVNYVRDPDDPRAGPVRVGWALSGAKGPGVLYYPPERLRSADVNRSHAKSASRCPAVINLESRYFMVRSPIDIHLGFARDKDGKPSLRALDGDAGAVRKSALGKMFSLTSEAEWRYPDRPTIQMSLPYVFLADEPVYVTQLAPFMHYLQPPWPGTIFGGRFPITNWPRPLMWAFEWHDTAQPVRIRRGDPLFYALFEADRPDRSVQLIEAEITPEVQAYLDHVGGAVNYANQTFSLFDLAARARPETLVIPRDRKTRA